MLEPGAGEPLLGRGSPPSERTVTCSAVKRARPVVAALPTLVVAVLLLDVGVPVLPDDALVGVVTARRMLVAVGLLGLLGLGCRPHDLRTRLDLVVAVLVLAGTAATVRGGFALAPVRELLTGVALYYLVVGVARRDRQAWPAFALAALAAVVVPGAVALAQFNQDVPTGFCRNSSFDPVGCAPELLVRATGTFANPNLLAAHMVLLAPVAALAVPALTAARARAVGVGLIAVAYCGLVVAFSRSGYVATVAGGAAGVLAIAVRRPRWRRWPTALALAGVTGGAAAVAVVSSGALSRYSGRSEPWSLALQAAKRYPEGVGLGRAADVMNALGQPQAPLFHAHNLWLNWLVEAGVLGCAAMVALTVASLVTAGRAAVRGSSREVAVLVALVGFFVLSLAEHPANTSRGAAGLWIVLALAVSPASHRLLPGPRSRFQQPEAAEKGERAGQLEIS